MRVERLTATLHGPRIGFRLRLNLAIGVVAVLVVLMALAALFGFLQLQQQTRQAIAVDANLSRLSSQIAIKALQARRYEKDYLLSAGSQVTQAELTRWRKANVDLRAAIAGYASEAPEPEAQRMVKSWLLLLSSYEMGVDRLELGVAEGTVRDPRQAFIIFVDSQVHMALLADQAVRLAEQKNQMAQQAGVDLQEMSQQSIWRISLLTLLTVALAMVWCFVLPGRIMRPIRALSAAARQLAEGDLSARTGIGGTDEFGLLANSFDQMATAIQQSTRDLHAQYATAEAARAEATAAQVLLADQLATIEAQQAMIRDMSVPILPLSSSTLVMPLIGALDTSRLRLAQETALHEVEKTRARHLILDITGVPIVDTQVAQGLVQIMLAARLLGARVILVGIRPEVAQSIVGLGVDLSQIMSYSTLQNGISATITGSALR